MSRQIILSNKMANDIMDNIDEDAKAFLLRQIEDTFKSKQTEMRDLEMNAILCCDHKAISTRLNREVKVVLL